MANLGTNVSFIFGGVCVICLVSLWFFRPETAGTPYVRTDAEAMGIAAKDGNDMDGCFLVH
ncbi:uncharacterized protein N7482_008890 [Penicillium canariense]|uniref:Uncharacterized protein n=1 Tax=Penicillium canariense TaxID=189055 RepID=A0A9W9HWU6_9EURO|nr:uncharacterized protein N7482_008890 [Penicillium canariense]KAJ5157790.1 hypothetical protein N7482_008890 [Penicillium canariense]